MGRTVDTMEESPSRENIVEVWKDYTSEDSLWLQKKP